MKKSFNANETSGCLRVTLPVSANGIALKKALFRSLYYVKFARIMGGKARSLRSWDSVTIEHTGLTREQSKRLIDELVYKEYAATHKVIVEERDSPEYDLNSYGIVHGEFAWEKLDKHFLFSLPYYAIIVSSWPNNWRPVFIAKLEPGLDRSTIWKRACATNAAHRVCGIYWSPEDVREIYGFNMKTMLEGSAELAPLPFRL